MPPPEAPAAEPVAEPAAEVLSAGEEIKVQARDAALAALGGLSSMLQELLETAVFIAFL